MLRSAALALTSRLLTPRLLTICLLTTCLLGSVSCTSPKLHGERANVQGRLLRVVLHMPSDTSETVRALDVAETAWITTLELFGLKPNYSAEPTGAEVHLYDTVRKYERVERYLTGGRFKRNLGFAHRRTLGAHIALQPQLSQTLLRRYGVPPQSLRLIAHEASHLALYAHIPSAPWLPDWIDEGIASWVEAETLRRLRLGPEDASEDPWVSNYRYVVQNMVRDGRLPKIQAIFDDELEGLSGTEKYALRLVFFEYLRSGEASALRDLRAIARSPANPKVGDQLAKAVRAPSSSDEDLIEDFSRYAMSLPAAWLEYRRSLTARPGYWIQEGFRAGPARAFRLQQQDPLVLRGEVSIDGFYSAAAFLELPIEFANNDAYRLEFKESRRPALYRWTDNERQKRIAELDARPFERGEWRHFAIELRGDRLRVRLDDEQAIDITLPVEPIGVWGLGTAPSSVTRWRGLEPLHPSELP